MLRFKSSRVRCIVRRSYWSLIFIYTINHRIVIRQHFQCTLCKMLVLSIQWHFTQTLMIEKIVKVNISSRINKISSMIYRANYYSLLRYKLRHQLRIKPKFCSRVFSVHTEIWRYQLKKSFTIFCSLFHYFSVALKFIGVSGGAMRNL